MTTMKRPDGDNVPIVDRGVRPAVALRVVLLAVVLAASAGAFIVFKNQLDNELVLGVLGVLAMAGIFFVVSALIGFIEVMPQAARSDDLARAFLDAHPRWHGRHRPQGPHRLRQCGLWRVDGGEWRCRGADARDPAVAQSRRDRSRLSPDQRPARRQGRGRGVPCPRSRSTRPAPAARARSGIASRRVSCRTATSRSSRSISGRFPTSPPSGTTRSASSRNCRTPSTIWTMHRPVSSPRAARARSST